MRDGKKSYVKFNGADMYKIVKTNDFVEGDFKIYAFKGMRVYAFTFG